MKVKYVEYYYPGSFCSETSSEKLKSGQKIVLPKGAYAYRTFEREEVGHGKETLKGEDKNHSKMFIKGTIYTLAQIKRLKGDYQILMGNMKYNRWNKVIKCAQGFLPFRDMVLL